MTTGGGEADLVAAWLAREGIRVLPDVRLPRRLDPTRAPLSFSQQRLWFLDRLLPGNAAYHVPVYFQLTGPLSRTALRFAFDTVVSRHEILRTTIVQTEDGPEQRIAAHTAVCPTFIDLTAVGPEDRRRQLDERLAAEHAAPFDLAAGPLVRVTVFVEAPDAHVVACTLHHIVFDGWSTGVLIREIGACYQAYLEQRDPGLPALPIQYGDYASWERASLSGEAYDRELAYWRQQLDDLPALSLPADAPRPAVQSFVGGTETFELDGETSQMLRAVAASSNATTFITALSAFRLALARETGQFDLAIGSPIANRSRRELEPLIGFLVNTVVLRARVDARGSFRDLVIRERRVLGDAFAHQGVPFDRLVDAIGPERDFSRHPLVQVMFLMEPAAVGALSLPGLRLTPLAPPTTYAKFDLTMTLIDQRTGIVGSAQYNRDLFHPRTVRGWMRRFRHLLTQVVAEPDRPIRELALLPPGDIEWLMAVGEGPRRDSSGSATVIEQFQRVAAARPEGEALSCGPVTVRYGELDRLATGLSDLLRAAGCRPGHLAAICLDRSIAGIAAWLAVMKTGAAYAPLDPAHPDASLKAVIRDMKPTVVITSAAAASRLVGIGATIVVVDESGMAAQTASGRVHAGVPADAAADGDALAYVVHTSGSSGTPKGVMVSHANLLNLVRWHRREFVVTAGTRASLLAGVGFDASVWEVWPYLTSGASVHIVPPSDLVDPVRLRDWMVDARITMAFVPTPLAEVLLSLDWPDPSPLRILLTGGDVLHSVPAGRRTFSVVNNYGPTEHTVVATSADVSGESGAGRFGAPSIGRPIDGARVYLVDGDLRLVPPGAPGEIALAGASVALGYLHGVDLTAASFVPDPIGGVPGGRLYRTGDLARWRSDGRLEFLGRIDRQVKIRGVRVELSAIEYNVRQCEGIADALVEVVPRNGDGRLTAFVVAKPGHLLDSSAVRRALAARLPSQIVPADIIALDRIPTTPNGKVDRRALAAVESVPEGEVEPAVPATDTERTVAAIWCQLLQRARVGVTANFFDVGGHSLMMISLQQRLRTLAGRDIPIVDLFAHSTVRALAAYLDAAEPAASSDFGAARQRASRQREALERRRGSIRR